MLSRASLIEDLETAIASGSDQKRVDTLRRVTDLFAYGAERLSEEHVAVFDDVIGRLAADIETKARAELSRRLAPIDNAPIEVVRALARADEIDVAGPVLTGSTRLNDQDLIETAKAKGQDHLMAISKRQRLSEVVTDVLVDRGDREVVRSVAQNDGARFSDNGFGTLVAKSTGDDVLSESIGLRNDIPRRHLDALLKKASETVMKRLAAAGAGTHPHLQDVLADITSRMQDEATPARDYTMARTIAEALAKTGKLDDNAVADFARADKFEETAAALSTMCGLPVSEVERAMQDSDAGLTLIIARAAGLSPQTLKAILLMPSSGHSASLQDLESALKQFERLQISTARRVVRFYQVRQSAGKATAAP
jgi:uncharacterized protein (DUF2336 family)